MRTRSRNKHLIILIAMMWAIIIPGAMALTITSPATDITTTALPATVNLAWSGNATQYHVKLTNATNTILDQNTSGSQLSAQLTQGTHTLEVTGDNTTATRTFTITKTTTLGLTTDKQGYDVGAIVHITATSSEPVSANLALMRDGQSIENYTLSISGSVDLFYIPEDAGAYTATLTAQSATATASWTATQASPLTASFTYNNPQQNQPTVFTASASGGREPYTYQWLFSDQTSSTGKESTHYFFETGAHTATLIVTDADNSQVSKTQTFTVNAPTYDVEVTVRDDDARTMQDIVVTVKKINGTEQDSKTTPSSGTVKFTGMNGMYNLTLKRLNTIYLNRTINITKNTNLLYTITFESAAATTNTTNTTTNTTAPIAPATEEPAATTAPEPVMLAGPSAEEIAAENLERSRTGNKTTLSERRFNLKLSAGKDKVLAHLGLYKRFDAATQQLEKATDEEDIDKAMIDVPTDVKIDSERSQISYPDLEEMQPDIEAFLEAKGIKDENLAKQYRKNIEELSKNVSIKSTIIKATVQYADKAEKHTIITREITGPEGIYAIENIPKDFAEDASKLTLEGDYEVIKSDPILRFTSNTYTYSAKGHHELPAAPVMVPDELKEYGVLQGLMAVTLGKSDPTRSVLYLIIIGMFLGGLVAGKKMSTARASKELFGEFSELASQAIEQLNKGMKEQAAAVTPDIERIFEALPQEQQEALKEVIAHLQQNRQEQEFLQTLQDTYAQATAAAGDVNAISAAYEQAIAAYEKLPAATQGNMKGRIDELDAFLEHAVQT